MRPLYCFIFLYILFTPTAFSQSSKKQCESNIELLRLDLISMLNKTVAMPPVATVYVAAKKKYDSLQDMRNRMNYSECVDESQRVLNITKPYGNR